jgi:hypothetical protein
MTEKELERFFDGKILEGYAPKTLTNPSKLKKHLQLVKNKR